MFKKSSSHNEQKRVVTTVLTMPYLPDELLLNCLARISRLYYPTLSLISKRFHSLLASTELYRTRRLLGSTENCIYACLLSPHNQPHWCTLGRQPTLIAPFWNPFRILRNRTRMSSSGNLLVSVPSHNFFPDQCPWISTIVGSDIYIMIGGYNNLEPSSSVFVVDYRVHTWHEAPSMLVAKKHPLKSKDRDFSNFIEFFDPETNIWEHVPSPCAKIHERHIDHCCSFRGNLCLLFRDKAVVYNPKENKWDVVAKELKMLLSGGSFRMLNWYDCVERSWGDLKGMKKLPELPKAYRGSLRLENCGGKIVLLWEENVRSICSMKEKMIWCAEVALERLNSREIYGKVKWCHVN
ncbi:hypothetical protein HID58_087803 [Brassica napus]|uniref:BnaC09g31550D protein n=3 Tax=Brassica TaxID=3705 RepID=A0A078G389_BRANA|nr:hypothetical protein HID58_087803 [Brassica napus]CAF1760610.1 unnamed protein product [Brassica napus]CDY19889.1 BnaC09g31550D [Brassica napus]